MLPHARKAGNGLCEGLAPPGNQRGAVLLITLLVMAAIAVLGVMSISTSMVESAITRCGREIRESFYLAEAGALEGVSHLLQTTAVDLADAQPVWHHCRKSLRTQQFDFRRASCWDADGTLDDNSLACKLDQETFFAIVEWEVAPGSSLVVTKSRLYINRVYGLCRKYKADNIIEIGYARRY